MSSYYGRPAQPGCRRFVSRPSEYQARLPGISGNPGASPGAAPPRQPATSLREIHPNSVLQPSAHAHVPQGPAFQPALGPSVSGSFAATPNFHASARGGGVDGIGAMPPMHPNPAAWAAITQMLPQHQQQQQVHHQQQSSNGVHGAPAYGSNAAFPSATTQAALRATTLTSSAQPAQPAQQQGPASDAQHGAASNTRPTSFRQATGSRGPQSKWTVPQQVAVMKQANASSGDRQKERKEVVWKRDAELLRKHEAFGDFVGKGGDLSYTKIRDKYASLVKTARDKDRRAQWESGVRDDQWGKELITEVDQALGSEEDLREQREAAAEGRLMIVERQERQGQEHKIDGSVAESEMNEKRHDLEQSTFDFEKEKQQKADADVNRRAVAEANRDDKRRKLDAKRIKADVDMPKDDFAIRKEEMQLANKREDNRAAEAREQTKLAAENQKQQTDMMLS